MSSCAGLDCCIVDSRGNSFGLCTMLGESKALSYQMHHNIKALAVHNVQEDITPKELIVEIYRVSEQKYPVSSMIPLIQASTYVPLDDAIDLQIDSTQDANVEIVMKDDKNTDLSPKIISSQ